MTAGDATHPDRPGAAALAVVRALLAPWRWLTTPEFLGLGNLPTDRPCMLAGNHTVMGMLDLPLMVLGLYERQGLYMHGLADHLHFQIPGWREFLASFGAIEGTRDNCRTLMRAGESILVYPGGAREVMKRKGEKYQLIWKERLGFVRLAIEHGYPIVPFAAIGAEECYDIVLDAGDVLALPFVGSIVRRFAARAEEIPPLVRGVAGTLLPRPQHFYFWFGGPIETASVVGRETDDATCLAVREHVRRSVEGGIMHLLGLREREARKP